MAASPEGTAPSTLMTRLDMLVQEKLITKTALLGVPARPYRFELTIRGRKLLPILEAMMQRKA